MTISAALTILKFQKTRTTVVVVPAKILIYFITGKIFLITDLLPKVPTCRTEATNENRVFVVLMTIWSMVLGVGARENIRP